MTSRLDRPCWVRRVTLAGVGVVGHPGQGDAPECGVRLSVAAAVQAVTVLGLAAGRWDGCGAAEPGEGRFAAKSAGVVAGRDEQRGCGVGADTVVREQLGCGC